MKRFYTPSPVFTPSAATLDFTALAGFDVRRLAAVLDLKTGAMIYGPIAGFGYSSIAGSVLTLQAPMTGLAGSDPLLTIYDDSTGKVAEDTSVQAVTAAIQALAADVVNNHADLGTLHTDLSATLHQDLQAILTKLGGSPAQDGADATGVTMPAGGAGIRGWLSGIYSKVAAVLPVSVASLPLPAGAAQDGSDITGAAMPAGGAGIRGWLSAIYTKLTGTVSVSALTLPLPAGAAQDATVGQAVTVLNNVLAALALLATDADLQATTAKMEAVRALLAGVIKVDPSAVTSPISAAALPLPAGAATENTLSTIKQILATQASIAESTWYDPTVTPNAFYFRRVVSTDGVVSEIWTDPTGAQVTFSANWKPLSSASAFQVLPAVSYDCIVAATGMSVSDVVVRVIILNLGVTPPTIAASMWLNANTGAVITSPVPNVNVKEVTKDISIPDGGDVTFGAQADAPLAGPATAGSYMGTFRGFWTNWLARVPVLGSAIMAGSTPFTLATDDRAAGAIGGAADVAATADAGAFSLVALAKRSLGRWTTLLALLPAGLGQTTMANSFPVTVASDTPLAKDGTDATGVTPPAGGAGIRGWLSGIYNGLASTVTTALGKAFRVSLVDPATGNASLVQAFHNSDNQAIGNTSYGLFTGGVDQLINSAGNLDRKRAVAGDAMAPTGLSAEVPMLFNGTAYDRAYGDKTNGAWVNIKSSAGSGLAQDGTDITAAAMPAGGVGIRGWLSAIYNKLTGTVAVSAATLPLPAGAAADGTDMTMPAGVTAPASGAGIRGWLSSSWVQLLALATGLGTQADPAVASATGTGSVFGWIKQFASNDATALAALSASATWQTSLLTVQQAIQALLGPATASQALAAANATVALAAGPSGTVGFEILNTSTWVGTIQAFGKIGAAGGYDTPLMIRNLDGSVTTFAPTLSLVSTSGVNLTGRFFVEQEGMQGVQLVMSAYTSGSAAVSMCATPTVRSTHIKSPANDPAFVSGSFGGLAIALNNAWPVQPGTGTTWTVAGSATVTPAASTTWSVAPSASTTWTVGAPASAPVATRSASGLGALTALPTSAIPTNGTPMTTILGAQPSNSSMLMLSIPPGGEVDIAVLAAQTTSGVAPYAMAYVNPTVVTLDVLIPLNGMSAFLTYHAQGSVRGAALSCGARWL